MSEQTADGFEEMSDGKDMVVAETVVESEAEVVEPEQQVSIETMTDEQKAEIKETLEAARKRIHDEVLTDEQRAKLKELRANLPKRPPPPPRKPGQGGPRGGPYEKPEKED